MVTLRLLHPRDVDTIVRWHNDPELYSHLVGNHRPVGRDDVVAWLNERLARGDSERNLAICDGGVHVGNLYLRDVNQVTRSAALHIFIADIGNRGRGLGGEAMRLAIEEAFGNLRLETIYLHVLATNDEAIRLYTRCGFVLDGALDEPAQKPAGPVTVLRMSLRNPASLA